MLKKVMATAGAAVALAGVGAGAAQAAPADQPAEDNAKVCADGNWMGLLDLPVPLLTPPTNAVLGLCQEAEDKGEQTPAPEQDGPGQSEDAPGQDGEAPFPG